MGPAPWRERHCGRQRAMTGNARGTQQGEMGGWRVGLAPHITSSYLFKWISNQFEFELVKDGLLLLKYFQIKYGSVDNWIRNNISYWMFSKLGTEFELKLRELNWIKFDWFWGLGTWKLCILMKFDMEVENPGWNTFPFQNIFKISTDFELVKKILVKLIWMNCGRIDYLKSLLQIHQSSTLDKKYFVVIFKDCTMIWVTYIHYSQNQWRYWISKRDKR
jgi:hypothetical protein